MQTQPLDEIIRAFDLSADPMIKAYLCRSSGFHDTANICIDFESKSYRLGVREFNDHLRCFIFERKGSNSTLIRSFDATDPLDLVRQTEGILYAL